MNELKSCPFCGSTHVHVKEVKKVFYRTYRVECWCCGAGAGSIKSIESAVKWWNTRAIDQNELLDIAEDLDCSWSGAITCEDVDRFGEDVDRFERKIADRIRKAIGECDEA